MTGYVLDPAMPVLCRPDGVVQVGWDPRRAVLVRPPRGLTAAALAELLRTMQSGTALAELQAEAVTARCGRRRTGGRVGRMRWWTPAS